MKHMLRIVPISYLCMAGIYGIYGVPAALAADYYVSPSGSDANQGTLPAPFKTILKAYALAQAGDTIYLRGGIYQPTSKLIFNKVATAASPIRIFSYANEIAIIDGANESEQWRSLIEVPGSYHHIRGLEVRNASNMGVSIRGAGSGNTLERLNVHRSGRVWDEGSGINIFDTAANNLILNCDAHHNYAPRVPGNADGIRSSSRGTGNILRGNRSYRNADDGFDMWNGTPTVIENNVAFENGYDDNFRRLGDGNGFKLGGSHANRGITSGGHTLRNNLAFRNPMHGFDENTADLPMKMYNNTAYKNGPEMPGGVSWTANYGLHRSGHVTRNNLSFGVLGTINADSKNDSWSLPVTVNAADFLTLDDSSMRGPRNADGSIPASSFLRLAANSDLIDKGVNVGLPYTGSAPDLGAFESVAVAPIPPKPTPPPVPPTPSNVNLLLNGGFEQSTANWDDWGNAVVKTDNKYAGKYALRIGAGEGGRGQVVRGIKPGATYALTGNGKIPSGKGDRCAIGIDFLNASGNIISSVKPKAFVTSGGWATSGLGAAGVAPATAVTARVWLWKDAGTNYCYVDNLSFMKK